MSFKAREVSLQENNVNITVSGLLMYKDCAAGEDSARAFCRDFAAGTVLFDDCTGVYRLRLDLADGKTVFAGDNAGLLGWYVHQPTAGFYTTFTEAAEHSAKELNAKAIAQFLYYGCIYGLETPVSSVCRTDPNCYYVAENGTVSAHSKNLTPLEQLETSREALGEQMQRLAKALEGQENIACTITGGTDSRAILAHMLHNGQRPLLDITGGSEHIDVAIAKEIAERVDAELLCMSDEPEGDSWVDEAIRAADGMAGVCGTYRLYKKARCLHEKGILLECGGGAGELYKNSFINQDFPVYGGKPNWDKFLRMKVATYDFPLGLCGDRIRKEMQQLPENTAQWLKSHQGNTKAEAYLCAGYEIMQNRGMAINAMNNRWYTAYSPLMERRVVASSFHVNPWRLEMQAFQREQVSRCWPSIKGIRTDRGLTCDADKKTQEFVKSMLFLVRVALRRIFRRGRVVGRVDSCFEQGLSSPQFYAALDRCKELEILAPDVKAEQIPRSIADQLFALGTVL